MRFVLIWFVSPALVACAATLPPVRAPLACQDLRPSETFCMATVYDR